MPEPCPERIVHTPGIRKDITVFRDLPDRPIDLLIWPKRNVILLKNADPLRPEFLFLAYRSRPSGVTIS